MAMANLTLIAAAFLNATFEELQQLPPPDDGLLHKQFWPLDYTDATGFACAGLGVAIAAGGGIGGGGLLVPIYVFLMQVSTTLDRLFSSQC
jgi:hypothetical protein